MPRGAGLATAGAAALQPRGRGLGGAAARAGCALAALACLGAAAFLAWHHPLAPVPAVTALALWAGLALAWPGAWLFVLPAGLPLASLAPWTGWIGVEEFDLLVLGAAAGGYARLAWVRHEARPDGAAGRLWLPALLLGAGCLLGLYRGWVDAGMAGLGWFQGHAEPLNGWRVAKGLLHALLLLPLLRREVAADAPGAWRRFAGGLLAGLGAVAAVVLWERAAYPGLLDFSSSYRVTALFWEMHVGGAAIDAYLALAAPAVAWALWTARTPLAWGAAAGLALLVAHAALVTFSRGVYLAVAGPLGLLALWAGARALRQRRLRGRSLAAAAALAGGAALLQALAFITLGIAGLLLALLALAGALWLLWRRSATGWRAVAGALLAAVLFAEGLAVLGAGSFMRDRVAASGEDLGSRFAHWQQGLRLLQDPADWAAGLGLGRLPVRYAASGDGREFPGSVQLRHGPQGQGLLRLAGPAASPRLAGRYGLAQRVPLQGGGAYRLRARVRVAQPVELVFRVCEAHLLYERECQSAQLRLPPRPGQWQSVSMPLEGPWLASGPLRRGGMFSVWVAGTDSVAEFDALGLQAPDGRPLLANGDFSAGLAHWLPLARHHFLPWHIDNLYLELLIERGVPGLLLFLAVAGIALQRLRRAQGPAAQAAPFLAASLCGALLVGLVSSVMDVPRVAFLLWLAIFFALVLPQRRGLPPPRPPGVQARA